MGLADFLKGFGNTKTAIDEAPTQNVRGQPVKTIEVGTTGTQIYGGYLSEEHIAELRGRPWQETIDKIRRSDPNVKMTLQALKLPLKSSHWFFNTVEESEMAEMQKRLIEKVLFHDINKPFTKLIGEIVTMIDCGFSLFEITHEAKIGDAELGDYTSIKSIAFRAQKTIERWNVDKDGNLISVYQIAYGDLGKTVELDSRFLLHFAPEAEGDNFEGISVLRAMYGNWLRKNHFLKLLAAGIEKFAIPTPVLTVPEGKENSPEYDAAVRVLKAYTSNQSNYITKPAGWDISFPNAAKFDAENIRQTVNMENQEMVNSILASFLILGQNGASGNRALGDTLSDFFKLTIQQYADHIAEQMQRKIFEPLIKMNFGDVPCLVELKCEGLSDVADSTWATMLATLKNGGMLTPDKTLEAFIRERCKLPEMEVAQTALPALAPNAPETTTPPNGVKLSEMKLAAGKSASKQKETANLIRDTHKELKNIYGTYLSIMGEEFIQSILKERAKLSDAKAMKAIMDAEIKRTADYKTALKYALTKATYLAQKQAQKQMGSKVLKLAERTLQEFKLGVSREDRLAKLEKEIAAAMDDLSLAESLFATNPTNPAYIKAVKEARDVFASLTSEATAIYSDIGSLSAKALASIEARAALTIDSQIGDMVKNIGFQFITSEPSTDSDSQLEKDLSDRLDKFLESGTVEIGSSVMSAQVVNDARIATAKDLQAGDDIESFTYVAVHDDKTTELCEYLDGRTFAADDPNADRFNPPLHYNCRSYFAINMRSFENNPPITEGQPKLTDQMQKQMNLSEKKTNVKKISNCNHKKSKRGLK